MEKKLLCIRCPRGCELTAEIDKNRDITKLSGNNCKLGIEYAEDEIKDPRRILTTTVKVEGGTLPLCPVWTETPVPKDKVMQAAAALRKIVLKAPVKYGDIAAENLAGTGINAIASRDVEKNRRR